MRKALSSSFSRAAGLASRTNLNMFSERPIRLILDFDGTITKNDTLSHLAWAGYNSPKNNATSETWSNVADLYLQAIKTHTESYVPQKEDRKTVAQELAWLESLKYVEQASFKRVRDAGIFKNVDEDEIRGAARQLVSNGDIVLRDGWLDLIKMASSRSNSRSNYFPVEILSVNFSRQWIRSCLNGAAAEQDSSSDLDAFFEKRIRVLGNEICDFGPCEANDIQTSKDKVRIMTDKILGSPRLDDNPEREVVVYIGDSLTDLGCLLAADVGCCICDDPPSNGQKELHKTLQRFGFVVDDLANFSKQDAQNLNQDHALNSNIHGLLKAPLPNKIWRVRDFDQVSRWLST